MKKSYFFIFSLFVLLTHFTLNVKNLNAEVYFMTKPEKIYVQDISKPCILSGYKLTADDCKKDGLTLNYICPHDSRYGKSCSCDTTKFMYDQSNCSNPKSLTGSSCGTKYENCDCDAKTYKYFFNTDCPDNKVVVMENSCIYKNKQIGYAKCTCPAQYFESCGTNMVGVGASCEGRYQSCKCESNFTKCNNGAAINASTCTDSEGIKYNNCKIWKCDQKEGNEYAKTKSCRCNSEVRYQGYMRTMWYKYRTESIECRDKDTNSVMKTEERVSSYGTYYSTESDCLKKECAPYLGETGRYSNSCSIDDCDYK